VHAAHALLHVFCVRGVHALGVGSIVPEGESLRLRAAQGEGLRQVIITSQGVVPVLAVEEAQNSAAPSQAQNVSLEGIRLVRKQPSAALSAQLMQQQQQELEKITEPHKEETLSTDLASWNACIELRAGQLRMEACSVRSVHGAGILVGNPGALCPLDDPSLDSTDRVQGDASVQRELGGGAMGGGDEDEEREGPLVAPAGCLLSVVRKVEWGCGSLFMKSCTLRDCGGASVVVGAQGAAHLDRV
jgi:hypothetical protein